MSILQKRLDPDAGTHPRPSLDDTELQFKWQSACSTQRQSILLCKGPGQVTGNIWMDVCVGGR